MKRTARIICATSVAIAVVVPTLGDIASAAPAETTTTETTVTVGNGDSLVGLSHRYQVRLSALLRANEMALTSVIHPGDAIVIPTGATLPTSGGSNTSATRTATARPATPAATSSTDYVVLPGDALAGIAWRHGVTLGALVRTNGISATSLILPGQHLQIPAATRPIPTGPAAVAAASPTAPSSAAQAPAAPSAGTPGGALQSVLSYATAQVGLPYQFFSAGPAAFDCSGLVVAAFRQVGMSVPHQSRALARMGSAVDWHSESIAAGDLVFTSTVDDPDAITHVGIALDSRRWVQAVGVGRTVSIGALPSDTRIMAVRRLAVN